MTAALARNERFATRRKVSEAAQAARRSRAFGEQTVESGSSPNRFTYVGKRGYYCQPDLGNYWLRARVYEDASNRYRTPTGGLTHPWLPRGDGRPCHCQPTRGRPAGCPHGPAESPISPPRARDPTLGADLR